jgi:hypothetical protein
MIDIVPDLHYSKPLINKIQNNSIFANGRNG